MKTNLPGTLSVHPVAPLPAASSVPTRKKTWPCCPAWRQCFAGAVLVLFANVQVAHGVIKFWTGMGSNNYWGNGANWQGGSAPNAGDDLIFQANASVDPTSLINTNNYANGTAFRSITFATGASGYKLDGNSIQIGSAGGTGLVSDSTSANQVNLALILAGAQSFKASAAGGPLLFSGSINLNGHNLTNEVTVAAGIMEIGYPNGLISGTGNLYKSGAGELLLSGLTANTYVGSTYVLAGALTLNDGAGGSVNMITGDAFISAGASLIVSSENNEIPDTANITVYGTSTSSGKLVLESANETIGSLTLSGGGDVDTGTGTLTLGGNVSASASYTGILERNSASIIGNLSLGASTRTFSVVPNNFVSPELSILANVSGSAGAGIIKTGSGEMRLAGTNTYTGFTAVSNGWLYAAGPAPLGSGTAGLSLDGGDLRLDTATITNKWLTNSIVGTLIRVSASTDSIWKSNVVLLADCTIEVQTNATWNIIGVISGAGGITKTGPGTLIYSGSGANTYEGATTVNEGELQLGKTSAIYSSSSLTIGDGWGGEDADIVREIVGNCIQTGVPVIVRNTGLLDLNGFYDYMGPISFDGAGRVTTGSGTLDLVQPVRTWSSDATNGVPYIEGNLNLRSSSTFYVTNDLFITAKVSGAYDLIKAGNDSLFLRASNSYTGLTIIREGALWAEWYSTALGTADGGTIVSNGATLLLRGPIAVTNEALTLNGHGYYAGALHTITSGATDIWTGPVTLNETSVIYVQNSSGTLQLLGPISGTGGLDFDGSGTLVLAGSTGNTYAGDTRVYRGTLELGKTPFDSAIPGNLTVLDADTNAATVRYLAPNQIPNDRTVVLRNTAVMNLATYYDGIGTLDIYNGQVLGRLILFAPGIINALSTSGAAQINQLDLQTDATINVPDSAIFNRLDINGPVNNIAAVPHGLRKIGSGSATLKQANTYDGLTIVENGFLWINNALGLGSAAAGTVVSNNASLVLEGNFGVTNESLALNGVGALPNWGALDAETVGTNLWTGPITLNADTTIAPYGAGTHLRLLGVISGPGGFSRSPGNGTLYIEGASANTFTGTTRVPNGALILGKTVSNGALVSNLIIGDGSGSANTAIVRNAVAPQLPNTVAVTIHSDGLYDLNNIGENLGSLEGTGNVQLGTASISPGQNNASTFFSGVISGSGGLFKNGTGTMTLSGSNTYSGITTVTSGVLAVNGIQPQSAVSIGASGTLQGIGTVGDILCSGNLSPGAGTGRLTCSNLTLAASGNFIVELNGPPASGNFDQLRILGTNNLGSAALHVTTGFVADPGISDTFTIMDDVPASPITGTFLGLPDESTFTAGGYTFRVDYGGGTGNDVVLTVWGVPGESVTVNATDRGWYDYTGTHVPGNQNYMTGGSGSNRNWIVFNVPIGSGNIVDAQLIINCYTNLLPAGFEKYVLRHVSTPIATLRAGGAGLTGIYNDLANGVVYGVRDIFVIETAQKAIIPLNGSFLTAAALASGGQIALGGSIPITDGAGSGSFFRFSGSSPEDIQLRITFGTSTVINALDHGWYSSSGYHDPGSANYVAGYVASVGTHRNWFAFALPALGDTLFNAQLLLNPFSGASPSGWENYVLHDVVTPTAELIAGGTGKVQIYNDLADGVFFGGRNVFVTENSPMSAIALNSRFVAAARAASSGTIALGGSISTIDGPAEQSLFGYSIASGPSDTQLWLGFLSTAVTNPVFTAGSPEHLGGNVFRFALSGDEGSVNEIQASFDLANWDHILDLEMTAPTTSFLYTNTLSDHRFFRARRIP